jgi:hypothetical protein
MTARAFDRLLYTDCRAGAGRGAGGGFQVQAQSAGVDSAQSKMAVSLLLYDAQSPWIMQRRAVENFPLGFAHACEEGYGTAQSRYVGKEATGGREGNHLADCLLTRDPDLYGATRPAQLWRSDLWRGQPWGTKNCPQFEDTPPLGPLSVDAVAEWLRARPERAPVLARLLSVLEDPAGRRVVITAAGPDEALPWIAGATLLLPVRSALEVSFKVFCSNPLRASQRIVAVPRELNAQVVPGRADSTFVLDAEGCISDNAEVSRRAGFWVEKLARTDDPYDVVDAVELAESLDPGMKRGGTDAMITAWAVTVPDERLADPTVLFRCLAGAGAQAQQEHGTLIVRRLLAASPSADALRWIDAAAAAGRVEVDRLAARGALLTAEIAEVRAGGAPSREYLTEVPADPGARRDADSQLSSAIVLASDREIDLLLRLSRRHHIEPQLAPLLERLGRFVAGWADHPALDYSPGDWALREEILDLAHSELQFRLAERGVPGILGALKRWWPLFAARRGDSTDPLDCHIEAAAIRALPRDPRPARVSALIGQARHAPSPATMASVQRALVDWQVVGAAEAGMILVALPASVPVASAVIELAMDEVERMAERPTGRTLDVLAVLDRRGLAPVMRPFADLLAADRAVMGFIQATVSRQFLHDISLGNRWLAYLDQIEPRVVRARLGPLLQACLDFPDPGIGGAVLCMLRSPEPRMLLDLWARELAGAQGIRAAAWAVAWFEYPKMPEKLRARIAAAISEFGLSLKPEDREPWFLDVQDTLPAEQARTWAELAGYELAKPRRGRRSRDQNG